MKIGIITMHRVANSGSALQAYALQHVVENMGHEAELIDYIYPNNYHYSLEKYDMNFLKKIVRVVYSRTIERLTWWNFRRFYKNYFKLSGKTYKNAEEIKKNCPQYDVYMSGSDQVWNPKSIGHDTSFMLSFTSSINKMAYSSSFATNRIPDEYLSEYKEALSKYKFISVRENSSCKLVKELTGKDALNVLDPALLMDATEWSNVSKQSTLSINKKYILVYLLGYSFNIFPYATELVNYLQEQTGYEVVILAMSRLKRKGLNRFKSVSVINPENFLYLIEHAEIVVTDSFHATAMSLNFSKKLFSLIKSKNYSDSRVYDLLKLLNAQECAVELGTAFNSLNIGDIDYEAIQKALIHNRNISHQFLETCINSFENNA